jgi:hypothetical protein
LAILLGGLFVHVLASGDLLLPNASKCLSRSVRVRNAAQNRHLKMLVWAKLGIVTSFIRLQTTQCIGTVSIAPDSCVRPRTPSMSGRES